MTQIPQPATNGEPQLFLDPHEVGRSFTGRSVICIGTFDGVHRGHQAILDRGRAIASARGHYLMVVTFHPHPKSVVAPKVAKFRRKFVDRLKE